MIVLSLAACAEINEPEVSKILVAYFSGINNTEGVAKKLADRLEADIYEIVSEQPYTDEVIDYGNSGSMKEVEASAKGAKVVKGRVV